MESELEQDDIKDKRLANLAPYMFKKGQSGNPNGRPPGKSLKERARAMLNAMTPEEEQEFLEGIDKKTIWEMAEGKAKQDMELSGKVNISNVLDELENGRPKATEQGVENQPPIQNQEQGTVLGALQQK